MHDELRTSDAVTATVAPAARVPVDVAGLLVASTSALHESWRGAPDAGRRAELAAAATLAAHAAIDALLDAWARRERPDLAQWRTGTTLMRAARFTAALRRPMPSDLRELCQVRRALGREPTAADLARATAWFEGDGAERAYRTVLELQRALAAPH